MFLVRLAAVIAFLFLIQCMATKPSLAAVELQAIDKNDMNCTIQLILPKNIYAVPEIESNIYFDNICLVPNIANYIFEVDCPKGIQQMERWTFVPSSADIGSYPLVIEVRDETNRIIARASTMVRVINR